MHVQIDADPSMNSLTTHGACYDDILTDLLAADNFADTTCTRQDSNVQYLA